MSPSFHYRTIVRSFFNQSLTLMGRVQDVEPHEGSFRLACRSGDTFEVYVGRTTQYSVLRNLDGLDRDRVLDPDGYFDAAVPKALRQLKKYVWPDGLLIVQGIYYEHGSQSRYEARLVHLLHSEEDRYLFEDTHWWLTQISLLADEWLDDLFADRRSYRSDDFAALYRTNLNILGLPTDDKTQEMATLSRLIYGLSSAYLLTGGERYLEAARAGIKYQCDTFARFSHDNRYCFWIFGRRRLSDGTKTFDYSLNSDDYGTVPLYEQIYALAGLTQYFRITCDEFVLTFIRRTVAAFNRFFLDYTSEDQTPEDADGYFSHLDYEAREPGHPALGDNRARKNWNSIGDHMPAYLINLILALDPLPEGRADFDDIQQFVATCKGMLRATSELIADKFPDPDPNVPYVRERFKEDWTYDPKWRWQEDRAIVGHNLKIAWNLTRAANYYYGEGDKTHADKLMDVATRLGDDMAIYGIDQIRGGCYDAVERVPKNGMPIEFAWGNTKDFWQQEQAILAYLILHGCVDDKGGTERKENYKALAREMSAFWNVFFLDHDNRGVYFRTTDDGLPFIQGEYAQKGGHSISGYHAFELNFLAHLYIRAYVEPEKKKKGLLSSPDNNFVLYFKPDPSVITVNVLPDFFPPKSLRVANVVVGGMKRKRIDPDYFQVDLDESERGREVVVEFESLLK